MSEKFTTTTQQQPQTAPRSNRPSHGGAPCHFTLSAIIQTFISSLLDSVLNYGGRVESWIENPRGDRRYETPKTAAGSGATLLSSTVWAEAGATERLSELLHAREG
jgi:hypothetical protein